MAVVLEVSPLVFVRELAHGPCYAFPLADPTAVERGESVDEVVDRVGRYLEKRLSKGSAGGIASLVYPPGAALREVAVVVARPDLPRRIRIEQAITIPSVVVPDGNAHWAFVIPLDHTVFIRPGEDLERRVADEVRRQAAARGVGPSEYLKLLPASKHHLVRVPVTIERADVADAAGRAAARRREATKRKDDAARKLLTAVGEELVGDRKARKPGPPVLGRDREVATLASLLTGRDRLSVMLVGPGLSGKSAVVRGTIETAAARLGDRRVIATSGAQLVAGQSGFGQLEQRVHDVMEAAERLDAILYFDDLGDLVSGKIGGMEDLAAMLRPWVTDGRTRVVGEITPEMLEHLEKVHAGFFGALARITLEPATPQTTREIMVARLDHQRTREPQRPRLSPACIDPLVTLSQRYLSYDAFPGKAVRLAEELRAIHDGEVDERGQPRTIEPADVYRAFSVRSGIPMFLLREEQAVRYTEVLEFFARRVIGQRAAIERVAQALCMVKAGLQPPARPLANLLFVGPTGVGKTEVAKTLARFLYGTTERMVRFDMSEFTDPLAAERLIRGTQSVDGELTRRVRQQPFCVVLLDEIEKAHPAVFDLLLQVLGEGRLSDARGRTTWFHNCIVIMTSNIGARQVGRRSGFAQDEEREASLDQSYRDEVDRHFRPEFVNRLDRVIPFSSLTATDIATVARVSMRGILERDGIAGRGVDVKISDRALAQLAAAGHSDAYGARALRRHLEHRLVVPMAELVAQAGAGAEGAALRVVLAGAEEPADAGPIEASVTPVVHDAGELSLSLHPRHAPQTRRALGDLEAVSAMRRAAATCMTVGPIEELSDRIDHLVADLARGSRRGRTPPGQLVAEHAQLETRRKGLRDALEALEGVEDLAAAATAEGDDVAPYREEADQAFAQFERAFVEAIFAAQRADEITLLVRGQLAQTRLVQWLVSFLRAARTRGDTVTVHRFEDPDTVPGWEGGKWGGPRDPAWVLESLANPKPEVVRARWRAVLVRVRGSCAASRLAGEAGIHRWAPDAEHRTETSVAIYVAAMHARATAPLEGKGYALGESLDPKVVSRKEPVRVYDREAARVKALHQELRIAPDDYWAQHDRVLFSLLAPVLLAGGDPFSPEDEDEG